jgi:hypothetical protein
MSITKRLHVKPAVPGAIVRDPHTKRALPDAGGRVPDNSFWRRRLAHVDVVEVEEAELYLGGERVTVAVPSGDSAADIATAINKHNNIAGPAPSAPSPAMKGE